MALRASSGPARKTAAATAGPSTRRVTITVMDPKALDKLLLRVLERAPDESFELDLTEPTTWADDPLISSKEADLLLQEAQHQGLVEGETRRGRWQRLQVVECWPNRRGAATSRGVAATARRTPARPLGQGRLGPSRSSPVGGNGREPATRGLRAQARGWRHSGPARTLAGGHAPFLGGPS